MKKTFDFDELDALESHLPVLAVDPESEAIPRRRSRTIYEILGRDLRDTYDELSKLDDDGLLRLNQSAIPQLAGLASATSIDKLQSWIDGDFRRRCAQTGGFGKQLFQDMSENSVGVTDDLLGRFAFVVAPIATELPRPLVSLFIAAVRHLSVP